MTSSVRSLNCTAPRKDLKIGPRSSRRGGALCAVSGAASDRDDERRPWRPNSSAMSWIGNRRLLRIYY
eukprot:3425422-Alexandrium_andersonii.AAC.1